MRRIKFVRGGKQKHRQFANKFLTIKEQGVINFGNKMELTGYKRIENFDINRTKKRNLETEMTLVAENKHVSNTCENIQKKDDRT